MKSFYKKINFEKGDGRCEFSVGTGKEGWDASNPQFMLYFDGKIVQGMDVNHTSTWVKEYGEKDVYIYAFTTSEERFIGPYDFLVNINYIDEETDQLVISCSPVKRIITKGVRYYGRPFVSSKTDDITSARIPMSEIRNMHPTYFRLEFITSDGKRAYTQPYYFDQK